MEPVLAGKTSLGGPASPMRDRDRRAIQAPLLSARFPLRQRRRPEARLILTPEAASAII
jgi:hypothetical protein